jgi:hypothetical protein
MTGAPFMLVHGPASGPKVVWLTTTTAMPKEGPPQALHITAKPTPRSSMTDPLVFRLARAVLAPVLLASPPTVGDLLRSIPDLQAHTYRSMTRNGSGSRPMPNATPASSTPPAS